MHIVVVAVIIAVFTVLASVAHSPSKSKKDYSGENTSTSVIYGRK